jgi:DNA repair protein RadA/Sms
VCKAVQFGTPKAAPGLPQVDDGIKRLSEVKTEMFERIVTGFADRNWGPEENPGIVKNSVTLMGGSPGAGKSTLCAQIMSAIAKATKRPTLYVGAEESGDQVKDRAIRLGIDNMDDMLILPLEEQVKGHKITPATFQRWDPSAVVVDSLSKYASEGGAEEAVRICESVKETAVLRRCPFIVICQVTKDEEFAGLNAVKHAVDTLLIFRTADILSGPDGRDVVPPEECGVEPFRILQTTKNRFGSICETYFTMGAKGLRPFLIEAALPPRLERGDGGDIEEGDENEEEREECDDDEEAEG